MRPETLHGMSYIHGLAYIACEAVHSCIALHYMPIPAFMPMDTLHALTHIQQSNPTLEGLIKVSAHVVRYITCRIVYGT